MGKRRHMIGFRVSPEEYHQIIKGHDASKKNWKMSEYIRARATGEIRHPFHDDDRLTMLKEAMFQTSDLSRRDTRPASITPLMCWLQR